MPNLTLTKEMKALNYQANLQPTVLPTNALREIAVDMKELKNVPIGAATIYSDATAANAPHNQDPFIAWLWNTNASRRVRANIRSRLEQIRRADDGSVWLKLPKNYFTKELPDLDGDCCWTPVKWAVVGDEVELKFLCLKDCESYMDRIIDEVQTVGSPDLQTMVQRTRMNARQVKVANAIESMALYTNINIVNGVPDFSGGILMEFNGLQAELEKPNTLDIAESDIFSLFTSFRPRLQVLLSLYGVGQKVFWMNPVTLMEIKTTIEHQVAGLIISGLNVTSPMYPGFSINSNGDVFFDNVPLRSSPSFAAFNGDNLGDIVFADGDSIGVYLTSPIRLENTPNNIHIRNEFTITGENRALGCATDCDMYSNVGAVFNFNTNHLAKLSGINIQPCFVTRESIAGMEGMIETNTLISPDGTQAAIGSSDETS